MDTTSTAELRRTGVTPYSPPRPLRRGVPRRRLPQGDWSGTADQTRLGEVLLGDLGRILLVEVDAGVELLHVLVGQLLLDQLDGLGQVLAAGVGRLLLHDQRRVVGREHAL